MNEADRMKPVIGRSPAQRTVPRAARRPLHPNISSALEPPSKFPISIENYCKGALKDDIDSTTTTSLHYLPTYLPIYQLFLAVADTPIHPTYLMPSIPDLALRGLQVRLPCIRVAHTRTS